MAGDQVADRMQEMQWGRRITGVLLRLENARRGHEGAMALGVADLRILWLFYDDRPRTLREIASELSLEQSTVNRQVNSAVSAGLLERSPQRQGGAYTFRSTTEGRDAFDRDAAISLGAFEATMAVMGEERSARLLDLMEELLAAYRSVVDEAEDSAPETP